MKVRSLGGEDPLEKGHGNPLQYSCLENAVDRGAWQATVHRTTHSTLFKIKRLSRKTKRKKSTHTYKRKTGILFFLSCVSLPATI